MEEGGKPALSILDTPVNNRNKYIDLGRKLYLLRFVKETEYAKKIFYHRLPFFGFSFIQKLHVGKC